MRVLVTRPAEDGAETAAWLREMGHQPLLAPLLTTRFLDGPAPALDDVQAILATSANGVRAFVRLSPRRDLPLFAVGPQTTEAAEAAGFSDVRNAQGDARALAHATLDWAAPDKGALLHVSGEQGTGHLHDILTARGFIVRKAVLYRVDAANDLPAEAVVALERKGVDAALFFSPRSAKLFVQLAAKRDLSVQGVIAVCISAATAAGLEGGPGFAGIRIATRPNQAALLTCLGG
ncbi:MAG TPA: uroporphyrinogen-III synthase [Rhizomicrobium sp.]|nr:uroporphyrinogen-III synthase [Rhizomicrobium sp.]